MYRVSVDTHTRDDVSASVAAHRELGRDYDDAVAEGLVERIGAEIDKRVDARIARDGLPRRVARPAAARPGWAQLAMGLGSMGLGIGATSVALSAGGTVRSTGIPPTVVHNAAQPGQVWLVALIWIVIAIVNVAYARRR